MLMPRQAVPAVTLDALAHGLSDLVGRRAECVGAARWHIQLDVARPHFDELLAVIDFALAHNYPVRGEYAGTV